MRRLLPPLAVLLSAVVAAVLAAAPAQAQLPPKRQWLHDVRVSMRPAIPWLDARVAKGGDHLAVVLDIDNTSLATHYAWPRPVKATLAFATQARARGVSVFFVTGRYQADAAAQAGVLHRAGYDYAGICGRRKGVSLAAGKKRCRKAITAKGYTIIASVGNLPSDFKGGYFERKFDLPDYHHQLS